MYPVNDADPNRLFPASHTLERFNDLSHVNRTTSACGIEIYRDVTTQRLIDGQTTGLF